jgi:hypothetical protein
VLWGKSTAAAEDARVIQALPEIARQASAFWHSAPDYMAHETLSQKALTLPKRRLRIGASAVEPPHPELAHREIISYYALSSFRATPEALHEFRQIVSVDGHTTNEGGRDKLLTALTTQDDSAKKALVAEFEKTSLAVAATDFGQLILLFTKANLAKYTFDSRGSALVGADRALVIDFRQSAGAEALRVSEPGKEVREPLTGQLWVRESDFVPLRITLNTSRREGSKKIRDEARVDYDPKPDGTVLPVSVVYRRFVDDELFVEGIYQYTEWEPVTRK